MPRGCARRRDARCACRCQSTGSLRRPRRGASSMPHSSTWPSRPVRPCCQGHALRRASARCASSVEVDVDRRRHDQHPIRDRCRRDVVGDAQGAGRSARTATSASGTRSASTPATSRGPAAERLIVWFEPELLPGYMWSFPLPNGRVNIGFGVQRDGVRRVQDMRHNGTTCCRRPTSSKHSAPGSSWRIATRPGRFRRGSTGRR